MTLFRPLFAEDQGRADYFVTQMEVLRSRALAKQTLEQLDRLSTDAKRQSAQIDGFMAGLTVSPVRTVSGESRVVSVTFRSSYPQASALYANRLAQAYVDQNLDVRREGSRQASKWLNERLAELRLQVNKSQQAMQQYREKASDAVALEDRAGALDYAGLEARVGEIAHWLAGQGLSPGDRVATWLPKTRTACLMPLAVLAGRRFGGALASGGG